MESEIEHFLEKLSEPKYIRILKILVVVIAVLLVGYIVYSNFIMSQTTTYFYDIGGEKDAKKPYLLPTERVSKIIEGNINYRNLTGHLVYFNIPIPRGSETINIQTRFKDNFPKNTKMFVGARSNEETEYKYNLIFESNSQAKEINWVVKSIQFDIKKENLLLMNNKLSLVFHNNHLTPIKNETNTQYIPIDYIQIEIYKPGLIDKWRDWRNKK